MSCCRATNSLIALYLKRSQRKMSYHPCPGEVFIKKWRKTTYRWAMEAWCSHHYSPTQIQRTKSVGGWKGTTKKPFRFKSAPPDFVNNQTWTITIHWILLNYSKLRVKVDFTIWAKLKKKFYENFNNFFILAVFMKKIDEIFIQNYSKIIWNACMY